MTGLPSATMPRLLLPAELSPHPDAPRRAEGADPQLAGPAATFEDILNLIDSRPPPQELPGQTEHEPPVLIADRSGDQKQALSQPSGQHHHPASLDAPRLADPKNRIDLALPSVPEPAQTGPALPTEFHSRPARPHLPSVDQQPAAIHSNDVIVEPTESRKGLAPEPTPSGIANGLVPASATNGTDLLPDRLDAEPAGGLIHPAPNRKRRLPRADGLQDTLPKHIEHRSADQEALEPTGPAPLRVQGTRFDSPNRTGLSLTVTAIFERAAVHVRLPAAWDVARDFVRELIASRLSGLGFAIDRIEVGQPQIKAPRQTGDRLS